MHTNLAQYFEPFAERLDKFISEHNLEVEKYRHDMAIWQLYFQHPQGGCGRVDIGSNGEDIHIIKWWTLDDAERLTRRSKSTTWKSIDNPLVCLEDKILEAIKEIIAWDEKELVQRGGIARGPWQDPAKRHQYPIPIL